MPVNVSFVRHRGQRDHVYVVRDDGTSSDWSFPTYGDQLPHDLCHLVVEQMLHIANGFWGLVEQGMEVRLVDNQGTLVKGGRALIEDDQFEVSDLIRAEAAVATFAPLGMNFDQVGAATRATSDTCVSEWPEACPNLGFALPTNATPANIAAIRHG